MVVGVGIAAWFAGKGVGKEGRIEEVWDTKAQIVGWISAFLYREPPLFSLDLALHRRGDLIVEVDLGRSCSRFSITSIGVE